MRASRPLRTSAFSLVELVVVLAIVAVLAGGVMLSVRSHLARARLMAACRLLAAWDAETRQAARAADRPLLLRIASSGTVRLPGRKPRRLGRGIVADRLWTQRQATRQGTLNVVVATTGQSETYAVRLTSSGRVSRWVVVLGGSGQVLELEDTREVQALLAVR